MKKKGTQGVSDGQWLTTLQQVLFSGLFVVNHGLIFVGKIRQGAGYSVVWIILRFLVVVLEEFIQCNLLV